MNNRSMTTTKISFDLDELIYIEYETESVLLKCETNKMKMKNVPMPLAELNESLLDQLNNPDESNVSVERSSYREKALLNHMNQ